MSDVSSTNSQGSGVSSTNSQASRVSSTVSGVSIAESLTRDIDILKRIVLPAEENPSNVTANGIRRIERLISEFKNELNEKIHGLDLALERNAEYIVRNESRIMILNNNIKYVQSILDIANKVVEDYKRNRAPTVIRTAALATATENYNTNLTENVEHKISELQAGLTDLKNQIRVKKGEIEELLRTPGILTRSELGEHLTRLENELKDLQTSQTTQLNNLVKGLFQENLTSNDAASIHSTASSFFDDVNQKEVLKNVYAISLNIAASTGITLSSILTNTAEASARTLMDVGGWLLSGLRSNPQETIESGLRIIAPELSAYVEIIAACGTMDIPDVLLPIVVDTHSVVTDASIASSVQQIQRNPQTLLGMVDQILRDINGEMESMVSGRSELGKRRRSDSIPESVGTSKNMLDALGTELDPNNLGSVTQPRDENENEGWTPFSTGSSETFNPGPFSRRRSSGPFSSPGSSGPFSSSSKRFGEDSDSSSPSGPFGEDSPSSSPSGPFSSEKGGRKRKSRNNKKSNASKKRNVKKGARKTKRVKKSRKTLKRRGRGRK